MKLRFKAWLNLYIRAKWVEAKRVEGKTTTTSTKTEAKPKRQMNTKESLIMNSEHQPLVLFSVENQVMLKNYLTF